MLTMDDVEYISWYILRKPRTYDIASIVHLLRVGWRNLFFRLCCCVSVFLLWWGIGFGVTYVLRVQYSCGVVLVFWFWWEIVFGFAYVVLSVQYSCAVVSVFWLWWERVLV